MYICNDCGAFFEEPRITYESHDYGEGSALEEWAICPYCKENDFTEAEQCSRCGEYFAELEDDLCDICWDEMYGE